MRNLLQDLRYTLRLFQKKPGFIVIAILTLGLGIGANTAVFSVVNAFLLRPLPYKDPDRLVMIQKTSAAADYNGSVYSFPVFNHLRQQGQTFDSIAAVAYLRLTLDSPDGLEMVFGARVTSDYFSVLGVSPMLGRTFFPGEDEPNKPKLVILSHALWQRRFNAEPNIVGQSFTADKEALEIVGVMPPDLKFDLFPDFPKVEFWTPLNPSPRMVTATHVRWLRMIGRLKPAATLAQTRTELGMIAERIKQSDDQSSPRPPGDDLALSAITLKQFFVGDAQTPLLILLGAVGFVLLIACVNVANLLLAHGVGRQKELALRAVLGATRRRLVSQLLTESLTLSVIGGALGLLLVTWLLDVIVGLTPNWMSRMEAITIDRQVFLFTLAASVFTGLIFGLLPAFHASKPDLQVALKQGTATATGALRGFRSTLVIAEVALAVVLLIGAGLMIKSFVRLTHVDIGFNPENILSMELRLLARPQAPGQIAFAQDVIQRLQSVPGIKEAAFVESLPGRGGSSMSDKRSKMLEGPITGDAEAQMSIEPRFATPGYFQTLGIRILRGRLFTDADTAETQPVVVVSQRMAEQSWPGEDPIGKRLLWSWKKDQRPIVIGVVNDVRPYPQEPALMLYIPFNQNPDSFLSLVIRTAPEAFSLTAAVRQQIFEIDRRVVIDNVMTMEQRLSDTVAQPRFYALLLSWFAGMGMLLAALGLYGVLSYTVSQQTREVGIRLALGAQPGDILKQVVGHGLGLSLIGLAIGLASAFALSRLLTSLLFGMTATDPATYATVSLLLFVTALLACYLPARRATKVDPMVALRYE